MIQGRLRPLDDVLLRKPLVVRAIPAPECPGGNDRTGAVPAFFSDDLAHHALGLPEGASLKN